MPRANCMTDLVFDAAASFTDVRRLRILHRPMGDRAASVEMLVRELNMSRSAVTRQTTKLVRRGDVEAGRAGRNLVHCFSRESKTPVRAGLLSTVRRHLGEG